VVTRFLLNISTHPADLEIIGHDWKRAQQLLAEEGFDGYELYPVGDYPWETIPEGTIVGMHLRYYPVLAPLWHDDRRRLLAIFGDMETVKHFYGGTDRHALISGYRQQLALAARLRCQYVVFHVAQSELEYIYNWEFPWSFRETVDLCAGILHAALDGTDYEGELLLENLWWPGSFRCDTPEEIEYVLESVNYPRTGIMLDTGHLLNTNQAILTEEEGIAWIEERLRAFGDLRRVIRGVHLTKSLSAEYVMKTRGECLPSGNYGPFRTRYRAALDHVRRIDEHEAFLQPNVTRLFKLIDPLFVTYEFTYKSLFDWLGKIRRQRKAMAGIHLFGSVVPVEGPTEKSEATS
jgi:sugar phosphate isomerase/epimerase